VSDEDVTAELERLKRENEALREQTKAKPGQISMKVSEKGAVSVYGLGRFPVTLYQEQWLKLLERSDEIREFIRVNAAALKKKDG
jgi:ABC-type Fe3+-hydroxamate transport system substrate-binding protein